MRATYFRAAARRTRLLTGFVLGMVLVGSCSEGDTGSDTARSTTVARDRATTTTTTSSTITTASTTTSIATPTTLVTVTTLAPATTGEVCNDTFGIDAVSENFPQQLSTLVGRDVRTGTHPCFERVVIELQGSGDLPGYKVGYVPDPVHLSPSDLTVEIAGDATLVLSVAAWMSTMEGEGYAGPQQVFPTNVRHIEELRLIENFEGMHAWAIGLDVQRGFRVTTLLGPPRIVVDIAAPNR